MGGTVYVIGGTLDPVRARRLPDNRSAVDSLLRRGQRQRSMLVSVPHRALEESLTRAFRAFLDREIPSPWKATRVFLEYLDVGVMSVHLCGKRRRGTAEVDCSVQVSFSACAGMAGVSAELAYHWLHLWLERALGSLTASVFEVLGFTPDQQLGTLGDAVTFLPVGEYAYALYGSGFPSECNTYFDVDESALEPLGKDREELMIALSDKFGTLMSDGLCRCQLCSPEFDPACTKAI
jgi:hypothetical protein